MNFGCARYIFSKTLLPLAALHVALASGGACDAAVKPLPPNIVFVLADDLGYGDVGCYGQKRIRTPHIDRLAREGMQLMQHYSGSTVCAPSRCVLMTGLHPGHAFIRNNRQVKPEGQYPIPADTVTLAKLLQEHGYATGAFGKWGLGPPGSTGDPLRQGFDRFFGYNSQSVAHNYYPGELLDDDRLRPLANPIFSAHQRLPAESDARDPASYTRYRGAEYAPDLIAQEARRFIRQHKDRPFFLYFPTIVPHLSLQVPEDSLAEYQGVFPETPYDGSRRYLPHLMPRAAYAAMITRMDREVGRLVELVNELGLDERTIFIFTSDNGPAAERVGGSDTEFFQSAGPLRGAKGSLYEGGIRVPGIVRWRGHVKAGATTDRVTGCEDWLPTILELVDARTTPPALDGISFAPTLRGERQASRPFLYREFPDSGGQQSVRVGDWKGVRQGLVKQSDIPPAALPIELYNFAEDIGEKRDVSTEHPDIVAQMRSLMHGQHVPSAEFPLPALDNK